MNQNVIVNVLKCTNPENPTEYGFQIEVTTKEGGKGSFYVETETDLQNVTSVLDNYLLQLAHPKYYTVLKSYLSIFSPASADDTFIEVKTSEDIRGDLSPIYDFTVEDITSFMLDSGYSLTNREFKFGWAMQRID